MVLSTIRPIFSKVPKREDRNKAFETGALDEGYADILGSLIEGENWTINEHIQTLRSLEHPTIYENASVKGGEFYYPDGYLSETSTLEDLLKKGI